MNTKAKFIRCEQRRRSCFACNAKGECLILKETHFEKKCPFYKTREEAAIARSKYWDYY